MVTLSNRLMNAEFHLLKRKNSKGKTVYYAAFLDDLPGKNGKRKYKSIKTTKVGSRPAAEKIARQMLHEGSVLASRDSLRRYLLDFWNPEKSEYIRSQIAEGRTHNSTYLQNNIQRIKQYVLPYFEKRNITKLSDLNRKNILEWRNYLFEHGRIPEYEPEEKKGRGSRKRKGTITAASQNKVRQAFFVALQWAVDMGMLPYHPGQGVRRVKEEKKQREIFELNELKALFSDPWPENRAYTACMLAVTTGARLGEVRGLLVKNVHLKDGYIDILTNFVAGDGLKSPKWDSVRLGVPIPELTVQALDKLIKESPFGADSESFVFYTPSNRNQPCDIKLISDGLKERIAQCEIKGSKTFHCFRHTYVSHLRGRIPEAKLQRITGHTNTAMSDRYTHANEQDILDIRAATESLIPKAR